MGRRRQDMDLHLEPGRREGQTRQRILEAARECFAQFGNEKTTLSDVARVAGVARQTLYRHFPTRSALLEAVDGLEDERMRRAATQVATRATTLWEFVFGLVEVQLAVAERYRTRQHLLELDRGLFQSLFLLQERTILRLRQMVAPALEASRRRGELRGDLDLDAAGEWLAITLAGVTNLTGAATFAIDDPSAVARFYATHLCSGLVQEGPGCARSTHVLPAVDPEDLARHE